MEGSIKVDLTELKWGNVASDFCQSSNEHNGSIKSGVFVDQLSNLSAFQQGLSFMVLVSFPVDSLRNDLVDMY